MQKPKFNWEDARYFLAVARVGTVGKAAQSLGVSNITLSRHLAHLQSRTRSQLLIRHSKGFKLSDEGHRLMEFLERAEAEIEAAADIFSVDQSSASGTVRIAAPEGFAVRILSGSMTKLLAQHPALNIEIVPQSPGFSLTKREADLAVMVSKPVESNLGYVLLGHYYLGLYTTKAYLENKECPTQIEDLGNHRLVGYVDDLLYSEKLNTPKAVWNQWRSQVSIYSPVGQIEAVKSGAGIGVLHKFLLQNDDVLVPVLPEIQLKRNFYLVYHQSTEKIPRIRSVINFLRELGTE